MAWYARTVVLKNCAELTYILSNFREGTKPIGQIFFIIALPCYDDS